MVGTSWSGKTTFARRPAPLLNAPHIELDALYWGPKWTPRREFRSDVLAAAQLPRWVIDGNYAAVREIVWRRCTAIVWLDHSFARVFSRALGRTLRRIVSREPLYAGNRETIGGAFFDRTGIPWRVLRTYWERRREYPQLFRRPEYGHATVIRLRTPAAAEACLAAAAAPLRSGPTPDFKLSPPLTRGRAIRPPQPDVARFRAHRRIVACPRQRKNLPG